MVLSAPKSQLYGCGAQNAFAKNVKEDTFLMIAFAAGRSGD